MRRMRMMHGGAVNSNLKSDRGKDVMNLFLILAFLFFIGSVTGWVLELFFRMFISVANPERKWINPGFCVGPYVPLYGFGLCFMYLIASLEKVNLIENPVLNKLVLFVGDYDGQEYVRYQDTVYSIYRTFTKDDEHIELHLSKKAGV